MPTVRVLSATGMSYRVPSIIPSHPSGAKPNTCHIQTSLPVLRCSSCHPAPAREGCTHPGAEVLRSNGYRGGKVAPGQVWEPARSVVRGEDLAATVCLGLTPASPTVCFLHNRSQLTSLQGLSARWGSPRHITQRQGSQSCEVCVHTAAGIHAILWIYTLCGPILPIATEGNSPFPVFSLTNIQFRKPVLSKADPRTAVPYPAVTQLCKC